MRSFPVTAFGMLCVYIIFEYFITSTEGIEMNFVYVIASTIFETLGNKF